MLIQDVTAFLRRHGIEADGNQIVVGVSGGVDSVVLLDLLSQIGFTPSVVHVNFGLRGEASDGDEQFVKALCAERHYALVVKHVDVRSLSAGSRKSLQELAREVRYREFERVASAAGIGFIATAHHREDQAETVLMNLMRGAGPDGISGIPAVRPVRPGSKTLVVRPLLFSSRQLIVAHAKSRGLSWRDDASNQDVRYRRNLVRHTLLPVIEESFGEGAIEAIVRSAANISDVLGTGSQPEVDRTVIVDQEQVRLPIVELEAVPSSQRGRLILEILKRFFPTTPRTSDVVGAIRQLANLQTGRTWQHPTLVVARDRDHLVFRRAVHHPEAAEAEPVVLEIGRPVAIPGGILRADALAGIPEYLNPETRLITFIDADRAGRGLLVDVWRAGDKVKILGSRSTKKVSDALTEARVPTTERHNARVVRSGDAIAWIVGVRAGGDFVVTDQTKKVIMLTVVPTRTGIYFRS